MSIFHQDVRPQSSATPTSGLLQRACACGQHTPGGGECESCKKKRLQRSAAGAGPATAPPIVHEVLGSGGQPLDAATRSFMEPRFGRDFSGVRVHTDAVAAESARAVGALAYTVGGHIAFGAGQYAPHTGAGRRLLAHELAHTVQQGGGSPAVQRLAVGPADTPDERAAEFIATHISTSPDSITLAGSSSTGIVQRQFDRGGISRDEVMPNESRQSDRAPQDRAEPPRDGRSAPTGRDRSSGMRCIVSDEPVIRSGISILFDLSSSTISPVQSTTIGRIVADWQSRRGADDFIVDGYASIDGPLTFNARLSCDRAQAVQGELVAAGVPTSRIHTVAHGETTAFSANALPPNRRAVISTGSRPHSRPDTGRRRRSGGSPTPERPISVCGDYNQFVSAILLIEPNLISDMVTCFCLGVGLADLLPIPGIGNNPYVEGIDCICNVLTMLQEIYKRGNRDGCWSPLNLDPGDLAAVTALLAIAVADCGSVPLGSALGGVIAGLLGVEGGPGGVVIGGITGAQLGDMIVDLAFMAIQNLIIQGTVLPVSQFEACGRLISRATSSRSRGGDRPGVRPLPRPDIDPNRRGQPTPPPQPDQPDQSGNRMICGPDVTSEIRSTLGRLRSRFTSWSSDDRDHACEGFTSLENDPQRPSRAGAWLNAWDIDQLHDQRWINALAPRCAIPQTGEPNCRSTVMVAGQCSYAGSVNYVVFGEMWSLCRGHYTITGPARFSETAMLTLIDLYKGGYVPGLPQAGNWIPSREWARAGYRGWSGSANPSPDRSACGPGCTAAVPAFRIYWFPHGWF